MPGEARNDPATCVLWWWLRPTESYFTVEQRVKLETIVLLIRLTRFVRDTLVKWERRKSHQKAHASADESQNHSNFPSRRFVHSEVKRRESIFGRNIFSCLWKLFLTQKCARNGEPSNGISVNWYDCFSLKCLAMLSERKISAELEKRQKLLEWKSFSIFISIRRSRTEAG